MPFNLAEWIGTQMAADQGTVGNKEVFRQSDFIEEVERELRRQCPGAGTKARTGAVVFPHRFGASRNAHDHFHACAMARLYEAEGERVRFHAATGLSEAAILQVQEGVRRRVLKAFVRWGLLEGDARDEMLGWRHGGGFSLDASVRIVLRPAVAAPASREPVADPAAPASAARGATHSQSPPLEKPRRPAVSLWAMDAVGTHLRVVPPRVLPLWGRNLMRQNRTDTVPYCNETDAVLTLNKLSDYAIVVASCLAASAGGQATARTLAQATRIPLPTVVKLLKIITAGGVLESIQGRNGGYRLARAPAGISLAEIIEAVEGPIALTECNRGASGCRVEAICGVRGHWLVINTAIRQTLAAISLADLAESLPGPGAWRPLASTRSFCVDLQRKADVPSTPG